MAKSFEENYDGDYSGIAVTNYGNNIQTNKIEIIASHPVPDINSYNAAKILNITKNLSADDLFYFYFRVEAQLFYVIQKMALVFKIKFILMKNYFSVAQNLRNECDQKIDFWN